MAKEEIKEFEFAEDIPTNAKNATVDKKYQVQFRENRSFELHIGRNMYYFNAYGILTLDEKDITHPDFIQQAGYFNIKEI
jgi:hypothetical protein